MAAGAASSLLSSFRPSGRLARRGSLVPPSSSSSAMGVSDLPAAGSSSKASPPRSDIAGLGATGKQSAGSGSISAAFQIASSSSVAALVPGGGAAAPPPSFSPSAQKLGKSPAEDIRVEE